MGEIFGVILTVLAYLVGLTVYKRTKIALLNPVLTAIICIIAVLNVLDLDYAFYNRGGKMITFILGPIVVLLAVPLYKNIERIKGHLVPVVAGVLAGMVTSVLSVIALCGLFGLDLTFMRSLYSKSITTPLAIEVTNLSGGIEGLTVVAVIMTGIIGATLAPFVMKIGKIDDELAKGIGIGTSSHGIGTSKAIEMGSETGSGSGLAMGLTGILTVLGASLIFGILS